MKSPIQALLIVFSLLLFSNNSTSQNKRSLQSQLQELVADKKAMVCFSILDEDGNEVASMNNKKHCTLHSVFKLHISLAMLSEIDKGRFALDHPVSIQKNELLPGMWSPLRDEHPEGGTFPISKLIQYAVSVSDNVACDVMLRLLGGPIAVEKYMKKMGIKDISVRHTEEEINQNNELTHFNWTTAKAANKTLINFFENKKELLSKESYDFIWKAMKDTETGVRRLKGQLPEGTVAAHKTGSSGTDEAGLTLGTNDIGIIFLPIGRFYYISVFVSQSKENEDVNERIIADISRLAFDHFMSPSPTK
jgi:beta-lactamase class A/beta-lactamase class A VEB